MALQLSNIKVAWTDKQIKQFRVPHSGQEKRNKEYLQYLKRDGSEEQQSLLEWLRCHSTVGAKPKALGADKYLVAAKFVSPFNPVSFSICWSTIRIDTLPSSDIWSRPQCLLPSSTLHRPSHSGQTAGPGLSRSASSSSTKATRAALSPLWSATSWPCMTFTTSGSAA